MEIRYSIFYNERKWGRIPNPEQGREAMSKFSVKKPLTVLVAVIVVVVLGFVSYTRMTPDLLPSIDLPYVLVMTTYPGATPEKVESTVTKPLEQSMATLENINAVQSTSAANYSLVVLEFTEDVDMDGITVDILQKINQIEGYWDDMVGTPTILKINPNMLPVSVAAVSMDGMDTVELSAFAQSTLIPALEGTAGVASISADGLLEETITVMLDEDKIEALNKTIRETIDKELDKARQELDDAKAQLEDGRAQLEQGKAELESGKEELNEQTADAEGLLNEKENELNAGVAQIKAQIAELKAQLQALEQTEAMLAPIKEAYDEVASGKKELETEKAALTALADSLAAVDEQQAAFAQTIAAILADGNLTDAQKQAAIEELTASDDYVAMEAQRALAEAELTARGLSRVTLPLRLTAIEQAVDSLEKVDAALGEEGMNYEQVTQALAELQNGKEQLKAAIPALEAMLPELEAGRLQLDAARKELELQKTAAMFELSDATLAIYQGEAELDAAAEQLEQGLTALEDGRQTAYDSADAAQILSMDTVSSLLMAQNFEMPAGYADNHGVSTLVSVGDAVTSLDELQTLVLVDLGMEGVEPIVLSDVAVVEKVNNANEVYARVNGADGVLLSFSKQSTSATAEVSENILTRFEELSKEYKGLHFEPLMDQGDYIYMMVDSIMQNLFLSALFAVLILFVFLKDIKPTLMTLVSIPLSVLFAIVLMYFSGVTLNMISMSALAVSIGMLVDNSVVVIENIYRLRYKGVDPLRAAVSGASQVAGAIMSSTITTVCVFLPIVFVEGLTRDLFTDMALTLGYALLASLIVALTVVPAMSTRLLKNTKETSHKLFDKFLGGYRRALDWALHRRALVLIVSVVLLVASTALALSRGFIFMPSMSSTQLTVSVETEKGSTAEQTKAVTDEAMAIIGEIKGVKTVGAMLSSTDMSGASSATAATMYVILEDDYLKKSGDIVEKINKRCADLDGTVTASGSGMDSMMSMLGGSGVSLNVYGDDLDTLVTAATDIAAALGEVDGLTDVTNGLEESDTALHFTVDKAKAAQKGLTVAQVYAEISAALVNESTATTLTDSGKDYEVIVVDGAAATVEELKDYRFTATGFDGSETEVVLADIASVEEKQAARAITRDEQRRYMTVSAGVAKGGNVTLATADAREAVEALALPEGVTVEFTGENETIMEAMEQLVLMLLLGILLVYLVMVAQFQSLKSPFIVMFTIPLAFTGGFLGLLLTGNEVSVISIIGFVMLTGIIVNNGIVLVDFINQLRAEGMPKREALLEAGVTRMRPILMTSVTTILGLLMTAVGLGSGNELMQPIAIVCIGGMIYATLMTLFVVPIMYDLFNRKELTVITDEQLTDVEE